MSKNSRRPRSDPSGTKDCNDETQDEDHPIGAATTAAIGVGGGDAAAGMVVLPDYKDQVRGVSLPSQQPEPVTVVADPVMTVLAEAQVLGTTLTARNELLQDVPRINAKNTVGTFAVDSASQQSAANPVVGTQSSPEDVSTGRVPESEDSPRGQENNNSNYSNPGPASTQPPRSDLRKHLIWAVALVVLGVAVAVAVTVAVVSSNNITNSNDNPNAPFTSTTAPVSSPTDVTTQPATFPPPPSPMAAPSPVVTEPPSFSTTTSLPTSLSAAPPAFAAEDPFNGSNPEDANTWNTNGSEGLELSIINALDPSWYTYFDTAVAQWDNGTPDALTLTVSTTATPESVCRAVNGAVKACSGNYGDTGWRGINKVLLENGWIYSSAVRMNDFYFDTDDDDDAAQRQYTMCHELGHGFGLPHTDENFFNNDLGNCLDYTENPAANAQPDASNFNFLAELYGVVNSGVNIEGRRGLRHSMATRNNSTTRNALHLDTRPPPRRPWFHPIPSEARRRELLLQWDEIDNVWNDNIRNGSGNLEDKPGWRVLHTSDHGQAYQIDLGDGFVAQIKVLLA